MGCEKYKPTYILIALNVVIYISGAIVGGNALTTGDNVILQWGQVNLFVFQGAYWQLFHFNVHSCINISPCRQHAIPVHIRFAWRRIVFTSGIFGNLSS